MIGWNVYTGPSEPGYTEQVYFMELFADSDLMTQAMLTHLSQLEGSATREGAPEVHRGQKVCTTGAMF
jgi:hypothetical protein